MRSLTTLPTTYKLIGVLAVIAIFLLVLSRFSRPTPQSTAPTPYPDSQFNLNPIVNDGSGENFYLNTALPEYQKLPSFAASSKPKDTAALGQLFRFTEAPKITSKDASWTDSNGRYLNISQNDGGVTHIFYKADDALDLIPPTVPQVQASRIALDYIDRLGLIPSDITLKPTAAYYAMTQGYGSNVVSQPGSANTTLVTLSYTYKDKLLVINQNSPTAAEVVVGSNGQILKIVIDLPPQINSEASTISVIDSETALNLLKNGQGTLFEAVASQVYEGTPNPKLSEISITSVDYLYVYNQRDALVPAYLFKGIAPDTTYPDITYVVTYIVPASR